MRPILIAKTGDTLERLRAQGRDFDRMFALGVEARVVEVHREEPLPPPSAVEGVVITGSPHSVTEPAAWTERLAAWLRACERPILGVCYGHQLLAHAFGGRVERNARLELGTIRLERSPEGLADPLLSIDERYHAVHFDTVSRLPPGATPLAWSALDRHQAFRLGERIWGVQFHPEFDLEIIEAYVEARADAVRADARRLGEDPEAALRAVRASLAPTPGGPRLLARFVELLQGSA